MSLKMLHDSSRKFIVGLCVVAFATMTKADDTAKYDLKFQFKQGEKLHYFVRHTMTMYTKFSRGETTDKNEVNEKKHFRIVKVLPDGTAELQTVFDHVRMSATFGENEPVLFDSKWQDKEVPVQFRTVKDNIQKPQAIFTIAPTGELKKLTQVDPSAAAPESEDGTVDQNQNILFPLPANPISVGDSWKETLVVKVMVNKEIQRDVKLLRTYKLDAVKDDMASISFATSILSPVSNPQIRGQLIQRTPSGTIQFDIAKGQMASRVAKTDQSVVNALGEQTVLRAASERVENRVKPEIATAGLESDTE